jgi:hypothetical protein
LANDQRWTSFVFLGLAAFVGLLDASMLSIALPSVQAEPGFSAGDRQWVFTVGLAATGLFGHLEDNPRHARHMWAGDQQPFHGTHHQLTRPINNHPRCAAHTGPP